MAKIDNLVNTSVYPNKTFDELIKDFKDAKEELLISECFIEAIKQRYSVKSNTTGLNTRFLIAIHDALSSIHDANAEFEGYTICDLLDYINELDPEVIQLSAMRSKVNYNTGKMTALLTYGICSDAICGCDDCTFIKRDGYLECTKCGMTTKEYSFTEEEFEFLVSALETQGKLVEPEKISDGIQIKR